MLSVTCGPMFSGKSSAILEDTMGLSADQMLIIKPKTDTRNQGFITTHNGTLIPATEVDPIHSSVIGLLRNKPDVTDIFIDEAQFFGPWLIREIKYLLFESPHFINVHVFGLDLQYNLEPWPIMQQLLPLAESVTKLAAECSLCTDSASKTIRTSESKDSILIGEGDHYEPRCNRHIHVKSAFNEPNKSNF